ncbi:DUF3422 domain-containing protein [Paralimibaculum aggregatum]|uniref:DUF3422 domain-containing protein n=1 Tax=Paralimibaculum aggregatum TaxID=3036245 RepID=A0ABQ6LNE6_9RHOB|nr:DUF3422 domain-containing protein [Limibaculum sp. NKW23]GMG84693.1 DUF3422 domain-containing protein [Limibaculum sp. NKW23]
MPRLLSHHPKRYALTNELHARPFQPMPAPGRVTHLAFKMPEKAADRDPEIDRAHLIDLIDRHGGPHPAPGANHYANDFGRFRFTWERHTEFVSYALWERGPGDELFGGELVELFPEDWLAAAPGRVVAATEIEIIEAATREQARQRIEASLLRRFNLESLAIADVLDGNACALGDFRIDQEGFTRFAVVVYGDVGPRRTGRLIQRLIEIETYRSVAMLALPLARRTAHRLNEIETQLTRLIEQVARETGERPEATILTELTALAAELEALSARSAFRFGAGRAYAAIVEDRIASLREERYGGSQLFSEFMARRFAPAQRTCEAAERRLSELAVRTSRISELLRTRVNFAVEAQNQQLLESMDRRAALQLRLQQTVEGLSVVAISYYAVSLASYLLVPLAKAAGISKELLTAAVAVPVIAGVWAFVRRIRKGIEHGGE